MGLRGPGELEIYRSDDGADLAVIAASWHLHPILTFKDLSREFAKNYDLAWRNYGSVIKANMGRALKDPAIVDRLANRTRYNPWDEATQNFASWFRGRPNVSYFVHIDLAKKHDKAGVAVVHQEKSGAVVVDLMHGVAAGNERDIQVADVRRTFVYGLTDRGFNIKKVSYDQWNSLESQQELTKRGYLVEERSVDKTMAAYDTLFGLLNTGRLDYYLHPQFIRELQQLRRLDKKYDHPPGGSKDIADGVAGAVHSCIEYLMEFPETGDPVVHIHRPHKGPIYKSRGLD